MSAPDSSSSPPKYMIRAWEFKDDDEEKKLLSKEKEELLKKREELRKKKEKLRKEREQLLSEMGRFGPLHGDDICTILQAKTSAWKHIVQKSGGNENMVSGIYKSSIKNCVKDKNIMSLYDSTNVHIDKLKKEPDLFLAMMVTDGCFFLQLALHILGGGELLGYPRENPYFGTEDDSDTWIKAMFFPGNQIPCVVIDALMKQPFFKHVIKKGIESGTWQQPTNDLAKLVLYQTVVKPSQNSSSIEDRKPPPNSSSNQDRNSFPPPNSFSNQDRNLPPNSSSNQDPKSPFDILDALRSLLLGSGDNYPIHSEVRQFWDLEAGSDDSEVKFPSAGELYKLGIRLKKGKRGIANIHFQNWCCYAYLYLPPFIIDACTNDLLSSLASHEMSLSMSDRELTAYFRFMRDLAHTFNDFKILEREGIIQVEKKGITQAEQEKLKYETIRMLHDLDTLHKSNFTLNFRKIRCKITDYGGPPWRLIGIILGALTVVQAIFAVLSYCIPRT